MTTPHRRSFRLSLKLAVVAVAMFGFGFALVPLYRVYCQFTGFNGGTDRIETREALTRVVDRERLVTVEFVANTSDSLPWEFQPDTARVSIHPGQLIMAHFHARNLADAAIIGQAVPSVTPNQAAPYFHKIECFCFTRQPLAPGEGKDMPVQFVVDPELPPGIGTVTLSYTFFSVPGVMVRRTGATPTTL